MPAGLSFLPNTLPATASSFLSSSGSRASGAVMSAESSARSEPIGQGSCSCGKSCASRATRRFAFSAFASRTLIMSCTVTASCCGMPAIEIGHHGDGGVTNLRFARELGLRHIRHADDRIAELLVGHALGVGRELRTFHADVGSAVEGIDSFLERSLADACAQARAHRMRHRYVRNHALAEERALTLVGPVDKLVDQIRRCPAPNLP